MKIQPDLIYHKQILQPNLWCYQQLLENTMFSISDRTVARLAMLDLCLSHFSENKTYLVAINNFAKTYLPTQAVVWFTKDSFIHRIINELLRTGNLEQYSLLRFYISDLSEQLYQLKCQQQGTETNTILYRGLRQSKAHLEILQNLVGHVIFTKDFMSNSRDKHVALCFAGISDPQTLQSQPLLIEIYVDMTAPDIIAVDIAHLSNFPEEREVLFDIGSQLRVGSLKYDSSDLLWYCRLVAISDKSRAIQLSVQVLSEKCCIDLRKYREHEAKLERMTRAKHRQQFYSTYNDRETYLLWCKPSTMSWITHDSKDRARILQQNALMNWHRSEDLYQFRSESESAWKIFEQEADEVLIESNDTACLLNNYGYACQQLKHTEHAISLLERASDIRHRLKASEHFGAQSLRNLGLAYSDLGDYENALNSLNRALVIGKKARPTAQWSTSFTLRNFGYFYHVQGDYLQATEYFFKASETFRQCEKLCVECYQT